MSGSLEILTPSSEGYEVIRSRSFNGRIPDYKPAEIVVPSTTADVVEAIKRATKLQLKVGVRSGGHHFPSSPLKHGGLLLDLKDLNKSFEYDSRTKQISFSPGHTVKDISTSLRPHGRFFPYGHSRTVGIGGFYLAGGQGCFSRGWGYTCDAWVTQLEIVTASGEIVLASATENTDLFWAAPGSGLGFFGVITKMWGRTIPMKLLYDVSYIIDATDIFKPLLTWALQTVEKIPKHGSDLFIQTFYADGDAPGPHDDSHVNRVFMLLNQTIHCGSIEEANVLASPWSGLPKDFRRHLVAQMPMQERTWEELWDLQEKFQPHGKRWKVDSILTNSAIPLDEVLFHNGRC